MGIRGRGKSGRVPLRRAHRRKRTARDGCDPWPFVALQTDATYVYYATGGNVARVPKGGGVSLVLASVTSSPSLIGTNMVIDAANVYFTDPQTGLLEKVALGGGPVTSLGVGGNLARSTEGRGIAVDTTSAYWCTGGLSFVPTQLMRVTPK